MCNTMDGYVSLNRKIINWEWYKNINTSHLFVHCLLRANHANQKWQGTIIKRGQFITSYEHLASETGLSVSQVRTAIKNLVMTEEIAHKSQGRYSVITINRYNEYQATSQDNSQGDSKVIATNNKENKENNNSIGVKKSKIFTPPTLEEVKQYCKERNNNVDATYWYDFYTSKDWLIGKNKMKDWKAAVRTWERNRDNTVTKPKPECKIDNNKIRWS